MQYNLFARSQVTLVTTFRWDKRTAKKTTSNVDGIKRRKAWFTITIFSIIYDETQNSMIAEEWEIKEKAEEDMIVENVENIFDNMLIKKAHY